MQNQVQTFASRQPHCLLLGPHSLTLSPRNIPFAGIKQDLPVLICSTIVGNFSIMRVHLVGALCSSCAFCRVSQHRVPPITSVLYIFARSLYLSAPLWTSPFVTVTLTRSQAGSSLQTIPNMKTVQLGGTLVTSISRRATSHICAKEVITS